MYFFLQGNATSLGVYKVHRGVRDYRDVGRMISFDDEEEMDVWGTDECNQYHGTDSSIFPPRLKPDQGLWAYEPSLCLSLGAKYVGPSKYDGISTREYTIDFGDASVLHFLQFQKSFLNLLIRFNAERRKHTMLLYGPSQ